MGQNRDVERDRLMMQEDYETGRQAAAQVQTILDVLDEHGQILARLAATPASDF